MFGTIAVVTILICSASLTLVRFCGCFRAAKMAFCRRSVPFLQTASALAMNSSLEIEPAVVLESPPPHPAKTRATTIAAATNVPRPVPIGGNLHSQVRLRQPGQADQGRKRLRTPACADWAASDALNQGSCAKPAAAAHRHQAHLFVGAL